ncbi:Phage tail assembly [Lactococcus cremoris]|nr:Phage tail assembly [Lactococcus cremoris]
MAYEKQIWNQYDDLKTEEENIENGAVVTDNRMNHIEEGIEAHTTDFKNPHKVTAAQVGLGNVPNYAAATEEEALAGESNDTVMTPSLTKAAAKSYVTKEDVGLSNVTNDEQATKTEFNAHTANKSNPHSVTASQVGAYSKTEADSKLALKANDSEVVHKTGSETIAGDKNFTGSISYPRTKTTLISSNMSGVSIYKDGNSVSIRLVGALTSTVSNGNLIGSIPTGYIPDIDWHFYCFGGSQMYRVLVRADGGLQASQDIPSGTGFRDTINYII